MKKNHVFALIIALLLCISLCACGGSDSPSSDPNESEAIETSSKEEPKVVLMELGDQIITDNYEFTLENVSFSYDVQPSDTSSVYMSYPAESGQVYVDIRASYKNISERDQCIRDLPIPIVNYDTKYSYTGYPTVDTGNNFDWVSSYVAATPLQTIKYVGMVDCPEEVKTSELPVLVVFVVDGVTYQYNLK